MTYASFWKRVAASIIDGFICGAAAGIIGQFIGLVAGIAMGISGTSKEPSLQATVLLAVLGFLVQIACYVLYYVWPECSPWQATIGKKIFGLKVTDEYGQRIGFWRSLGRNVGMIVSALILGIGYLMCIWTEKKQCLHDKMAGCLVVDETPNEKKGCAIAIIITVVLLWGALILGIIMAVALPQYARAVERARMIEATTMLKKMAATQGKYQHKHGKPASHWAQLDASFDCTIQADPHQCLGKDFMYTLSPSVITATRLNQNQKDYTLSFYPSGKIVCEGPSDWSKSICRSMQTSNFAAPAAGTF